MHRRFLYALIGLLVLSVVGCGTAPVDLSSSNKAAIKKIQILRSEDPEEFRFPVGIQAPITMSYAVQQSAKFTELYRPYRVDMSAALAESIAATLRSKGYVVEMGPSAHKSDATLNLKLNAAGFDFAHDSDAIVPRLFYIATLTRTADQAVVFQRRYVSGGGIHGPNLQRIPHDPRWVFQTPDEVMKQPQLVAERTRDAARVFGVYVAEDLTN